MARGAADECAGARGLAECQILPSERSGSRGIAAPQIIEETRQYLRDFDRIAQTTNTAQELYDQVLALYPHRLNPGALWRSAHALKP